MKHTWWLLLLLTQQVLAQNPNEPGALDPTYDNVSGNPYLFKDWSDGVIRFTSGRVLTQFKLKFNSYKNQLILEFSGSSFAAESKVREFVMYQKSGRNKDSMIFRKGYPQFEKATEETFYQVMFEGKITLLRLISKNISEQREVVGGNVTRRLEDAEQCFLFRNGKMTPLNYDKSELLDQLADKSAQLSAYISAEQIRIRTAEDIVKVIRKYNELL